MESEIKLYKTLLAAEEKTRLSLARQHLLELYEFSQKQCISPVKRMYYAELFVFAPLICDGPINEKELVFVNEVLHQNFSLTEANEIALHYKKEGVIQEIVDFCNTLTEKEFDKLVDMIVIALFFDSVDTTISDEEDQFLSTIQIELYFK